MCLGASGFIGANLLRMLLQHREDVYGTATRLPAWRLEGLPRNHVLVTDLLIDSNLDAMLEGVKPRTIFDCIAYGAYSFETDRELIYRTNFNLISRLLGRLDPRNLSCYVHAGSSSEYGDNSSGPQEDAAARAEQPLLRLQSGRCQPDQLSGQEEGACRARTFVCIRPMGRWRILPG